MLNRLLSYLESLSLTKRQLIKRLFISLIELPIISGIYYRAYYILIRWPAPQKGVQF